jgi:DNA-binding SARP family transcriptional activator
VRPASLVEAKCIVPAAPERLVARPRLIADLVRLTRAHRVIDVTATAGAGKTTLVVQTALELGRPVGWLTLDDTDAAPGRLLTYLDAAIRRAVPETPDVVADALAAQVVHPEAAALLAEAIPDVPLVLVIDEAERIAEAPAALAVLSSLIRYSRSSVTFILIGRRRVYLDVMSRIGLAEVGRLDEDGLAFTPEEAAEALALHGVDRVDVPSVVEAVGGWVAGVLFEAWRSVSHVGGAGGETDPLAGYLAVQILERLGEDEREFLVRTSLLDEVSRERAEALGMEHAGRTLERLRAQHLPATWKDRGTVMRCHPRFREYLRELLEARDGDVVRELRRRYGEVLRAEGRHDEAVDEFLSAGFPDEALACAETALPSVIARLDLDIAQRWIDRLIEVGRPWSPALLAAQLGIGIAVEKFGIAVDAADRLAELVEAGEAPPLTPEQKAFAAWGYWHVGRLDDARTMLGDAPPVQVSEVVQYLFALVDDRPPTRHPRPVGGPLDAFVLRIDYVRGRLTDVRDAPVSRWTPGTTERIAALRALGELERTEQLLAGGAHFLSNLRFEGTARAELMVDLGDEAAAREALSVGRERISPSGSFVFDIVTRLLEAKIELRLARDATTAIAILERAAALGPMREYGYLAEQYDLWLGYARLLQGRTTAAVERLDSAVRTMRAADRILELPTAAVYLSEARWRAEEAGLADEAAEIALEAARRQGSFHLLLQALRDTPSVLARQLDAEESPDGPWHDVAGAFAAGHEPQRKSVSRARVHLHDFGQPMLVVDGEVQRARLTKTYALLAFLVENGGSAPRSRLLSALFDNHPGDSARAYLRQAIHGLRQLLPVGLELETVDQGLRLSEPAAATTDSALLRTALAQAASLTGTARIEATAAALDLSARGMFLDGVECSWATERRDELDDRIADARLSMAVAAFEESRFDLAEETLTLVLDEDPLNERAWRLLIRLAAARGLESRVPEIYRRCEAALAEAGVKPSAATRQLLAGLRG